MASITALKALTAPTSGAPLIYVRSFATDGDGGEGYFYWDATSTTTDNGGTIIAPNAGGTGRWIRQFKEKISVRYFGAVGDGVTDDTNAIKAAITYAKTFDPQSKPTLPVYFPAGNYAFTDTLTLGHKVMLVGDGRWASRLTLTATLGAGVPAIRLDDPDYYASNYQHGNGLRSIGLNCNGKAEIGVLACNVNEGGGLYDSMVLHWTLYGFWAKLSETSLIAQNYRIDDCEIYTLKGNNAGKIGIYIDNGNHSLAIRRVTVICRMDDGVTPSTGSVGIMYAPGSSASSDADMNAVHISDCHFESCEDGVQIYQGRAIVTNCDGWTDVNNTVHWSNRGNGWCSLISNRNLTSGAPVKDSQDFTKLFSATGTDALRLYDKEPLNSAIAYFTAPYYPGVQGKVRRLFVIGTTTDANGDVTVTHNLGYKPNAAFTGVDSTDGKYTILKSRSATTVVINVRQAGGAIAAATSVRVFVETLL